MPPGFIPVEHFQTKLYQKGSQSKCFKTLTEDDLSVIAKKLYKRQEATEEISRNKQTSAEKLEYYINTLKYLVNPNIHFDLPEYDQRLAYLILAVDPELITFKEYLKIQFPSIKEITREKDPTKKAKLSKERTTTISNYENIVRTQLGFFDSKLLKYEELFFKRFYNKRELITEVGQNNEDDFIIQSLLVSSFDSITDQRYKEIVEKAELWLSKVPAKYKSKIAIYSITRQKELIGLKTPEEQVLFYILVVDPSLDMMRIYEEESMTPPVKARIIEQFGFYSKVLVNFEKKYHARFCPDKQLTPWTDTKKY